MEITLFVIFRWMSDEMLDLVTPKLLGNLPNTYTYTKNLAEHLLITEAEGMPVAIVRPSIVSAAWREPIPVYFMLELLLESMQLL